MEKGMIFYMAFVNLSIVWGMKTVLQILLINNIEASKYLLFHKILIIVSLTFLDRFA